MTKREMININNFFNLVAEDLQLGKVFENPVQVAGGFMHRMFKAVTEQGSYIIKLLNPNIMKRPTAMGNYKIADDIETILNILYTRATKANTKYFERRHSMWTNAYSYEDIGEFLREARRARGITQVEMARKLGFSSVTLSALETGKNVSAIKVDRYLQQLGFRMVIVPKGADVEVTE